MDNISNEDLIIGTSSSRVENALTNDDFVSIMKKYAKQQAIAFLPYLNRFQKEERAGVQKEYDRIGMFSWIGRSVEQIYDDFTNLIPIKSVSMPGIEYYYHTGVETNNLEEFKNFQSIQDK